jgi:hypothetical protein
VKKLNKRRKYDGIQSRALRVARESGSMQEQGAHLEYGACYP